MSNSTDKELQTFLKTLKVHNKDLDVCFNDALAVAHLENLIDRRVNNAVVAARIDELNRLNLYYLRHDGEGEHKLATQFDIRIEELTKKGHKES